MNTSNQLHTLSLIAAGTIAYITADVIHEVIGHGAACLASGGRITLLTSVYFRSAEHRFVTDACGPFMNLAAGLLAWWGLRRNTWTSLYSFLLMWFVMACNLFWFSWLCLYGGITGHGDFAFRIENNTWFSAWRGLLVVTGIVSYLVFTRMIIRVAGNYFSKASLHLPEQFIRRLFFMPWLAAGIAPLIAVAFYHPRSVGTFYEAITFAMFLPVLLVPRYVRIIQPGGEKVKEFQSKNMQIKLVASGIILYIIFCFTLGRGLHF